MKLINTLLTIASIVGWAILAWHAFMPNNLCWMTDKQPPCAVFLALLFTFGASLMYFGTKQHKRNQYWND